MKKEVFQNSENAVDCVLVVFDISDKYSFQLVNLLHFQLKLVRLVI